MIVSRRRFLQLGTLASVSLLIPRFCNSFIGNNLSSDRKLIVIQLSGGNDGLNTVIPYRNDIYYRSRSTIGITSEQALLLTDEAGLHPSLGGIKCLYDNGHVCILNSVGYPEPRRSHLQSMNIWHSGNTEPTETGWLGRYLDLGEGKHQGMDMDETVSLALTGEYQVGTTVGKHDTQNFEAQRLHEYPTTALGNKMKLISSSINSGSESKVYYATHGSFDTHVDQLDKQARLLKELDDAVSVLAADLNKNNMFQNVLVVVFSEFGRRVAQNATGGTDHGAANNMFLISGGLKVPGIYNEMPGLTDLDDGGTKYKIDFREVYATILDKWLYADAAGILGRKFTLHNFV